jgi:hypothetical protein
MSTELPDPSDMVYVAPIPGMGVGAAVGGSVGGRLGTGVAVLALPRLFDAFGAELCVAAAPHPARRTTAPVAANIVRRFLMVRSPMQIVDADCQPMPIRVTSGGIYRRRAILGSSHATTNQWAAKIGGGWNLGATRI